MDIFHPFFCSSSDLLDEAISEPDPRRSGSKTKTRPGPTLILRCHVMMAK